MIQFKLLENESITRNSSNPFHWKHGKYVYVPENDIETAIQSVFPHAYYKDINDLLHYEKVKTGVWWARYDNTHDGSILEFEIRKKKESYL